ncbi:MAG: hypothetical protein WC365_02880 [Candidatus Babeliales bacterium]
MNNYFKKIIMIIGINSAIFAQSSATITQADIELATAALRLPCSILEYDLRNSTSRSAAFIKALIHVNRLVNELSAKPPDKLSQPWRSVPFQANMSQKLATLWIGYDLLAVIKNLAEVIVGPSDKKEATEKADKFQDLLGYVVFPLLETAAATGRIKWESFDIQMPLEGQALALKYSDPLIILSRLGQLYCSAPQTSLKRKIYAVLVLICIIDLVVKAQKTARGLDVVAAEAKRGINAVALRGERFLEGNRHDAQGVVNDLFSSTDWLTFFKKLQWVIAQIQ